MSPEQNQKVPFKWRGFFVPAIIREKETENGIAPRDRAGRGLKQDQRMKRKKKRPPTPAELKRMKHKVRMGLVHFMVDHYVRTKNALDAYEAGYILLE